MASSNWWGFLMPAGTPKAVIEKLNKELAVVLGSEKAKKFFVGEGGEVSHMGPIEFGTFVALEIRKWARVVKEGNILLFRSFGLSGIS